MITQVQQINPRKQLQGFVISKEEPDKVVLHTEYCPSIRYNNIETLLPAPSHEYAKKLAADEGKMVYYCGLCFDESKIRGKIYRG